MIRTASGILRRRAFHSSTKQCSGGLQRVQRPTELETLLDGSDQFARVSKRAVLEVSGRDASAFLQGMQCNNMPLIDQGGSGMLTGFLMPQGRIIADAFIYPKNMGVNFPHPVFLVEVDVRARERLLKTLQFYRLRSQVAVRDASEEFGVWNVWGPGSAALVGNVGRPLGHVPPGGLIFRGEASAASDVWLADSRAPGMGLRLLLPKFTVPTLPASFEERPASEYALRRILKGVPEGCDDFVPDVSVPLECNMDYMHGVHFSKGCYVGQELTIRTHHRGVVRKRIVPVIFGDHPWGVDRGFDPRRLPQPHADIVRVAPAASADQGTEQGSGQGAEARPARTRKVPPGKAGSAIFNAGLALMRLEHVEQFMAHPDQAVVFETTSADGRSLRVSPWSPSWWPTSLN
ncbi:hypothetical protein BX661DRAFT_176731 [Kickxella alabastrina]|uniref:uncharacterized protein n=1 Tax=Kickxella alabastrina TaxID=61397 RepID=UPI002220255A|nr:uncharacterized protein BX661DRAFT_176731 [Kickxella alabastrina]KAI7834163.1 hypothetical protein BX661DRAFT_176731 [Kickxella alabastrina]